MVITISLSVGCMCCPSIPLPVSGPSQSDTRWRGGDSDKPSCLGEMGEGARLSRPSHNHSSVLQSLKSSEAARNFKKKRKKKYYLTSPLLKTRYSASPIERIETWIVINTCLLQSFPVFQKEMERLSS